MAFPKTKTPIKPKKIKKQLFARSWGRGATKNWKLDYYDNKQHKKGNIFLAFSETGC